MGNRTSRQTRNSKTTVNAGHSLNYRTSGFVDERGGSIPPPPPFSATGGSTYEPGNGYKYHKFLDSTPAPESSLVVGNGGQCDILVVAGGGSGGNYYGAGGGAGGVAYGVNVSLAPGTTYPVGVGTGGNSVGPGVVGLDGYNSFFGTPGSGIHDQPDYILAKGGGGGASHYGTKPQCIGRTGGSGGGSGGNDPSPADGTATQPGTNPSPAITDYGNPGGFSVPTTGYAPAGGGGAGAAGVGVPGDVPGGGDGGVGQPFPTFAYPLIGESPLNPNSPTNDHYAGGGGAGTYGSPATNRTGTGGHGGGGSAEGGAATNKLGGGGGGRHPGGALGSGDGGDGIVIVRYLIE